MDSRAFLLLSLALLLAAAAVGLWMFASQRQKTRKMAQHLAQSLEKNATTAAGFTSQNAGASVFDSSVADAMLSRDKKAGWPVPAILVGTASSALFYGGLGGIAGVFLVVGVFASWLAASAAAVVLGIAFFFLLLTRAQKYRAQLSRQLPGFLDNTVRLVTLGNSVQAAFQLASAGTKAPLQTVMERAATSAIWRLVRAFAENAKAKAVAVGRRAEQIDAHVLELSFIELHHLDIHLHHIAFELNAG